MKCSRCRKKITEGKYCNNCTKNRKEEREHNARTDTYRQCKTCPTQMINPAPNQKWCDECKKKEKLVDKKNKKDKRIPVDNMVITNFKYYKILEGMVSEENKRLSKSNREAEKSGRVSGVTKLARAKAIIKLKGFIEELLRSDDEYEKLLGKELSLEKEYMRTAEKIDLIEAIEVSTGQPASGEYTLAEIGVIFGLTRERVRQLQSAAEKVLKHPSAGRVLREYKGDGRNYYEE